MEKIVVWIWITSKRLLHNKMFFILLVFFPIISGIYGQMNKEDSSMKIALYNADGELAKQIVDDLLTKEGIIKFYESKDEETLKEDVVSGRADSGYIFYNGMEENIKHNTLKNQIGLISSPASLLNKLSTEIVFASYLDNYSETIIGQVVESNHFFDQIDREQAKSEMIEAYYDNIDQKKTFYFEYETARKSPIEMNQTADNFVPIRGFASVFLFIVGLFASVTWFRDHKKGIFQPVPKEYRPWVDLVTVGTPVVWASFSMLLAIYVSGQWTGVMKEVVSILCYIVIVVLFSNIVRILVNQELLLVCLIPMLTLGCLVFSPIIIQIKNYVEILGVMEKFFIPTYYLSIFIDDKIGLMLGAVLILALAQAILLKVKK